MNYSRIEHDMVSWIFKHFLLNPNNNLTNIKHNKIEFNIYNKELMKRKSKKYDNVIIYDKNLITVFSKNGCYTYIIFIN